MENPEPVDINDKDENTSLLEVQSDGDHTVSEKSKKPVESKAFNRALLRWTLYRLNKNTLSVKDLEKESLWSSVSCFVLLVFATLFALGFWQLQLKYQRAYYNVLPFHCICSIVYTVTFIRGMYIFRKPCVFFIVSTYLRFTSNDHHIIYSENGAENESIEVSTDEEESWNEQISKS